MNFDKKICYFSWLPCDWLIKTLPHSSRDLVANVFTRSVPVSDLVTARKVYLKQKRATSMYLCNPGGLSFIRGGSATCTGSNPLPFYILFLTVKVPLSYTSYWPVVPWVLSLNMNKSLDLEVFLTFSFHCHKMRLLALLGPFAEMTDFLTLLYTSDSEIPNLLNTWSLKKVRLSGGV